MQLLGNEESLPVQNEILKPVNIGHQLLYRAQAWRSKKFRVLVLGDSGMG